MNTDVAPGGCRRRHYFFATIGLACLCILGSPASGSSAEVSTLDDPALSVAQDPSLPPSTQVGEECFHLVGISAGELPHESLSQDDTALLVALRGSATLDEVLDSGVPFQTAQIQRLEALGLLEQVGVEFRTVVPMLLSVDSISFSSRVGQIVPQITETFSRELGALRQKLGENDQAQILPALVAWILQDRTWHHLSAAEAVDLPGRVDQQRLDNPDRGWWGVFWCADSPLQTPARYDLARSTRWGLVLDRGPDFAQGEISQGGSDNSAERFLAQLDDDAERVRRQESFPDLTEANLIDRRGRIMFPVLPWEPGNPDSTAAFVDAAARSLALEILASLPVEELAGLLGTTDTSVIAVLSYAELIPQLQSALDEADLSADPVASASSTRLSAVLWTGLTASEPVFPFPW
jgi:hypothetical protein